MSDVWNQFEENLLNLAEQGSRHATALRNVIDEKYLMLSGDDQDGLQQDVMRFSYFPAVQTMSYHFLDAAYRKTIISDKDILNTTFKYGSAPNQLADPILDKQLNFHPFDFKPINQITMAISPVLYDQINEHYGIDDATVDLKKVSFTAAYDLIELAYDRMTDLDACALEGLATFKTARCLIQKIGENKNTLAEKTYSDGLLLPRWYFASHDFKACKDRLILPQDASTQAVVSWAEEQFNQLLAMPLTHN